MEYMKAKLEGIIRLNGDVNWKGGITSCSAPNVLQVSAAHPPPHPQLRNLGVLTVSTQLHASDWKREFHWGLAPGELFGEMNLVLLLEVK